MTKKIKTGQIARFTIEGRGAFPLDMLRYDCCHPAQSEDASAIEHSFRDHDRWSVRLDRVARGGCPVTDMITVGRWESFGCRVVSGPEVVS
jgi:hypothetical protein